MFFIGVPNSKEKDNIVHRTPVKTIYVAAQDLAWDCQRHIDFLRAFADVTGPPQPEALLATEYAKYLRGTGRSDSAVTEKCLGFLRHFMRVREGAEPNVWAIVTEDGLRLDGSHRAAIACALGKADVAVSVVPTYPFDYGWVSKMKALREKKLKEATYGTL